MYNIMLCIRIITLHILSTVHISRTQNLFFFFFWKLIIKKKTVNLSSNKWMIYFWGLTIPSTGTLINTVFFTITWYEDFVKHFAGTFL